MVFSPFGIRQRLLYDPAKLYECFLHKDKKLPSADALLLDQTEPNGGYMIELTDNLQTQKHNVSQLICE